MYSLKNMGDIPLMRCDRLPEGTCPPLSFRWPIYNDQPAEVTPNGGEK